MLTLLIFSPNALGKDIDVFLKPLVDELKELWNEGVVLCDVSTKMVILDASCVANDS